MVWLLIVLALSVACVSPVAPSEVEHCEARGWVFDWRFQAWYEIETAKVATTRIKWAPDAWLCDPVLTARLDAMYERYRETVPDRTPRTILLKD